MPVFLLCMCFAYANKRKLLHAHQIQMGKDKILSEYDFMRMSFISQVCLQIRGICNSDRSSTVQRNDRIEHCVSSAKGCGFNSQGTHIMIKK